MRLLLTALLTTCNYFGLTAFMRAYDFQMDSAITVFLSLLLAVLEMMIIVIPIGNWLGVIDDGQASRPAGAWSWSDDE